ncbi:hypothetical protein FEM48_Zijuj09G0214800 [Ziziphus jujuba var. spinosa]|uniref:Uncharacterized protein n=1 Tax=Ziziphus jujuba var. spinosa TaxID=714518 RepID=A0A978UVE8_ZIZJJ|nr:hypothetical protein FEM48_Zijuj09G0214800 [Ziziphus jujuba var. spinosa]
MAHSTSTAFRAQLLWLLLFLCGILSLTLDLHVECAELEREALVHFKDDIEYPSRRPDQSLLGAPNSVENFLIKLLGSLEELDLSKNKIGGHLSINLGNLCNLRTLKLSHNAISGEITDFVNTFLSACSNNSLETLDLGLGAFMGNLPDTLGYIKESKSSSAAE